MMPLLIVPLTNVSAPKYALPLTAPMEILSYGREKQRNLTEKKVKRKRSEGKARQGKGREGEGREKRIRERRGEQKRREESSSI